MFAYCGNNPVTNYDFDGNAYRPVGIGIQLQFQVGDCIVGAEAIIYWDNEVCNGRGPVLSIYAYGGVSVDVSDAQIGLLITAAFDNIQSIDDPYLYAAMIAADMIGNGFSGSISAEIITGNDDFTSTDDYTGTFTSIGGSLKSCAGAVAYSESCIAYSAGYLFAGTSLARWGISKTNYYKKCDVLLYGLINSPA